MAETCNHIKDDGERCMAPVMQGSEYCFFHDPTQAKNRAKARKLGGRNRRVLRRSNAETITIESVADILALLESAVNDAYALQANTQSRARLLGYLSKIALDAIQVGELENRMAALEEIINKDGKQWDSKTD